MSPAYQEIIDKAMAFPLGDILERYAQEKDLSPAVVEEHERELRRFFVVVATHPDAVYGMSDALDPLLHTFILYTRRYAQFCQEVGGAFIHHEPKTLPDEEYGPAYNRFASDYVEIFGHYPPTHIWPPGARTDCDCSMACHRRRTYVDIASARNS
ncbi:MAG: hypothetical protein Q8R13_01595 [bacterium]|nr:hypothetical protein [bacterium]